MRTKSFIPANVVLAILAVFLALPAWAQPKPDATSQVAPVCANCHGEKFNSILLTGHGANFDAAGSTCQSCHGNAAEHLKDPMKAKPISALTAKDATAADKSGVCLTCHAGQRHLENWNIAKHRKVDVSCVSCHSIHGTQTASNNKEIKDSSFAAAPYTTTQRKLAYKTCVGCHTDVRGDILRPSHHPIIEGKIGCQDCHDPHGALQKASLRNDSINDLCLTCHTDKRGPFIHEHPPVQENCAICHAPHGSNHRPLLAQRAPQLCGDCHANGHTHGIYDGRGTLPNTLPSNIRFLNSGCVECHRQIHGSNAPASAYGQYFLR